MQITSAEFIISAAQPTQYPKDQLPQLALAGRSNVGKSSLINSLLNRKKLAHTSSTPGKTALLNFYKINQQFYFVDLPGYGYAKVSKAEKARWSKMIEAYLCAAPDLKAVLQIVDLRHPPTEQDLTMYKWLRHWEKPVILVASKADKLNRSEVLAQNTLLRQSFELTEEEDLLLFSATTGLNRDKVWRAILQQVRAGN